MCRKSLTLKFVLALTLGALPALSDDASWVANGRVQSVNIEVGLFDNHASVTLLSHVTNVSSISYSITGTCFGAPYIGCGDLEASHGTACNWSGLAAETKAAIISILGCQCSSCPKLPSCSAFVGDGFFREAWTCPGGPSEARCVALTGDLDPGLRLSVLAAGSCD